VTNAGAPESGPAAEAAISSPAKPARPVERLFPFAVRARKLIVGRETLARSKSKLQWLLIAADLSESSRADILKEFGDYPVVQQFTSADFERLFGLRNTKVLGFAKSTLAKSIYAELKESRINKPVAAAKPETPAPGSSSSGSASG
jgi:hypothetical protein